MKTTVMLASLALALFSAATSVHAATTTLPVTFDWTIVGNPGNAPDPETGFGAVGYTYRIAKHEVTNAQFVEFLNAVDPTGANSLGLFNVNMLTNLGGIENTGTTDGFRYIAKTGRENNPVSLISWYDAARFINWLHNGQENGDTESGAYTLLGGTEIPSNALNVTRNPNATVWLPSEDEWYKAAYHNVSAGVTGNYFDYATGSDSIPTSDQPFDNPSAANFFNDDHLVNGFNDGYAITGSVDFPTTSNPYSDVGSYALATSPYGTFDQNGNVNEWNEAIRRSIAAPIQRGGRGGSWFHKSNALPASLRGFSLPHSESSATGFRVATVIPEPSTIMLTVLASLATLARKFTRRASV